MPKWNKLYLLLIEYQKNQGKNKYIPILRTENRCLKEAHIPYRISCSRDDLCLSQVLCLYLYYCHMNCYTINYVILMQYVNIIIAFKKC